MAPPRSLSLPDEPAPGGDARMSAPSALRNRDAIRDEVLRFAPDTGHAVEIASGTGEHVVHFAAATPGLVWQPSDPDPARRASITAWVEETGLRNVRPPLDLDIGARGWQAAVAPADLLLLVNLLHLVSEAEAGHCLDGIAAALAPGGTALIYGPFLRDGAATSAGDAAFHASLQAQDPDIGYKDIAWVAARLVAGGLALIETVRMPANNLLVAVERRA